jgi:hypothetical protein
MYGSADGGKTVNFKDPILSEKMKQAASRMNLKGHYAGNNVLEKIYGVRPPCLFPPYDRANNLMPSPVTSKGTEVLMASTM